MDLDKLKEIEALANQKEKEWKHATTMQISSLQSALNQKEKDHNELNVMFLKLKEDFKYNLKLLQDRDKELKHYDETFAKSKAVESTQIAEISDLRIKVANITDSLDREQQARYEMQRHYRQKLIDQQAEMEAYKSTKNAELEEVHSHISKVKSSHERLEAQLRSEIESQKFELTSELESALQNKDREIREKEDKMKADVLASELKCKLLQKELELVKSAQEKQAETLQEADDAGSKLKKKLQEAENDIKDVSAVKNARILELEAKVQNLEAKNLSLVEDYDERRKQLDKDIRLKQSNMDDVRKAFLDKEKALEKEIRKLQSKIETSEHETRRALWDKNDLAKEHQIALDKLRKELQDVQYRFNNQTKIHSTSVVAKDVEIQNYKKKEDLMRTEISQLKESVEKYKRDLASATQKENLLLQSKVQLKMDWQQRCQEVEQKQRTESDGLIQSLTKSRDLAVAEVRKLRRQLGLGDENWNVDDMSSTIQDQVDELQNQNEQLKAVIQQMTGDMQKLATGHSVTNRQNTSGDDHTKVPKMSSEISPEYVKSLEEELMTLKREKRKWENKISDEDSMKPARSAPIQLPVTTVTTDHPEVKDHINSLNKIIGDLRTDKTELSAQLQKSQVRLRHQDSLLNTRESDVKRQLGRIQKLEYELSSMKRRNAQEVDSLKRRITDLELQVAETRREADEYYKGGIENNLLATELGSKLSQMKVDGANRTPWMGDIVQSGVVQQLRSELTEVRKALAKAKQELIMGKVLKNPTKAALLNKQLHEKLRLAAEQITLLLDEKSQLLEVGNSLRAELELLKNKDAKKIESEAPVKETQEKIDDDKIQNKMKQMEELQYQLTRQELQYAQRTSPRKSTPDMTLQPATTSTPIDVPTKDIRFQDSGPVVGGSKLKPLQYSLSSVGDNSMKDVWNMLDHEPSSPSLPGSKENSVSGQPAVVKLQKPVERRPRKTKRPKIRNYNIQNDDEAKSRQNTRNF